MTNLEPTEFKAKKALCLTVAFSFVLMMVELQTDLRCMVLLINFTEGRVSKSPDPDFPSCSLILEITITITDFPLFRTCEHTDVTEHGLSSIAS